MRATGCIAFTMISAIIAACGSVDRQLVSTSSTPAQELRSNILFERTNCEMAPSGRIEGGMIELPRLLPAREANDWIRTHGTEAEFPLINSAFSLGCGQTVERLPFFRSTPVDEGAVEVRLYSNAPDRIKADTTTILKELEPRLRTARNRLQVDQLRVILAVVCSDSAGSNSFGFRGVFNSNVPTSRAVTFVDCVPAEANRQPSPALRREITRSLAIAVHEAMHGVIEIRLSPDRSAPFVRLADELVATMVGAEFNAQELMLLAVPRQLPDDLVPCDYVGLNAALIEPFEIDEALLFSEESVGSVWINRTGTEYGVLIGRTVHALSAATNSQDRRAISRALTPTFATRLLDTYGTDLHAWTSLVPSTLDCEP